MTLKTFYFINPKTKTLAGEFHSKTPREAALKAATYDLTDVLFIAEVGKVHVFKGMRVPLTEKQQNDFTRKNNINSKPQVQKLLTENLQMDISPRTDAGIEAILSVLQDLA